jgi:NADPH:quinone reductase-like Zn-dependent oxidoreductase
VGTFAVQIAKSLGAHVTAVTATCNLELARSIGADAVIDYTKEDFTERGRRYDVLFDLGGNHSFADCRRVLSPNGTHLPAGAGARPGLAPLTRTLGALVLARFVRQRLVPYLARIRHEDLVFLSERAEARKLTPVIDRRYPLSEVPDAIRYVGTGHARGKVVINVG